MQELEKQERIKLASEAYSKFMDVILPGWEIDPNSKDTPNRVAKMYINELFEGLNSPEPQITTFENIEEYDGIVYQGDIVVKSLCSHHHMAFRGRAFVAYLPTKQSNIIGLSKLNRVVNYLSRRPQVQENLTKQIHDYLNKIIGDNKGVAVYIEAEHLCVSHRGVNQDSMMKTTRLSGCFLDDKDNAKQEFYSFINKK